jgi:hypothetical protein
MHVAAFGGGGKDVGFDELKSASCVSLQRASSSSRAAKNFYLCQKPTFLLTATPVQFKLLGQRRV